MGAHELGVFDDIAEAIDAAYEAQRTLMLEYTTMDRDRMIAKIKEKCMEVIEADTIAEFEETGYGRLPEKLVKNIASIQFAEDTSSLQPKVFASGAGLTVEYEAPVGLVGALTPVTNGFVTVASNAMMMLAAGNSIVFNAHPDGKTAAAKAVQLVNSAVIEAGGPENLATMVKIPDMDTLQVIMDSPKVELLIGTGGEFMVDTLMRSNKKVIAAGPGNVPVVIDETADIPLAAKTLYENIPFENNMLCITEKEAFVVDAVFDRFMEEIERNGARILTQEEAEKVTATALAKTPAGKYKPKKEYVAHDANFILESSGVAPSEGDLMLAVFEAEYEQPFVECEQLMPIFPVVRCRDVKEAMELAIRAEAGCRHSAAIWSKDIDRITDFARRIGTTCFVANGATVAATGMGGTGKGSSTIATFTGEGFTTASSFTRVRRFALAGGSGYTA